MSHPWHLFTVFQSTQWLHPALETRFSMNVNKKVAAAKPFVCGWVNLYELFRCTSIESYKEADMDCERCSVYNKKWFALCLHVDCRTLRITKYFRYISRGIQRQMASDLGSWCILQGQCKHDQTLQRALAESWVEGLTCLFCLLLFIWHFEITVLCVGSP